MYVAQTRIIHARPGQDPLILEKGEQVPGFDSWPHAVREAALHTGRVRDTRDLGTSWGDKNLGQVLKRMHIQMLRHHAVSEMGGEARLAAAERRFAPHSQVVVEPPVQPAVEAAQAVPLEAAAAAPAVEGFDCDVCAATLPSERGLKIHRSRAHKKR